MGKANEKCQVVSRFTRHLSSFGARGDAEKRCGVRSPSALSHSPAQVDSRKYQLYWFSIVLTCEVFSMYCKNTAEAGVWNNCNFMTLRY